MKTRLLAPIAAVLLLCGCAKVTQDNYTRIEDGMSEQDVMTLLGKPNRSNSIGLLGLSGTSSSWVSDDAAINVRFLNGRVALKSFESK
ncbi:MAG: hypothetical protein QOD26_2742 [Betaproteobacteria bacterium]|jgi:outer membrane murein-binding lipoprotein Lpp|nr:hypothetical protein [Betaproteobacteria bacterium]